MNALNRQVAGSHYKSKAIQPVEYIHANNLGFLEGCIVKRITRWREKDGFQDLEKIKHEVDLLIELETRKQKEATLANTNPVADRDSDQHRSGVPAGSYLADNAGQPVRYPIFPEGEPGVDPVVHTPVDR